MKYLLKILSSATISKQRQENNNNKYKKIQFKRFKAKQKNKFKKNKIKTWFLVEEQNYKKTGNHKSNPFHPVEVVIFWCFVS